MIGYNYTGKINGNDFRVDEWDQILQYYITLILLFNRYTKTDLVFRFYWKPNLGEGIPGQKTPRTLLAQFYLGFYPKTIMR